MEKMSKYRHQTTPEFQLHAQKLEVSVVHIKFSTNTLHTQNWEKLLGVTSCFTYENLIGPGAYPGFVEGGS